MLSNERLGRYTLLGTLGQGGMGTIHLAVAGGLGEFRKLLVVKELRRDLARNPRFVQMFLDEAKLAARLSHPNVVHTVEAGQDGERLFLSMEFLDGQPLHEIIKRGRVEPPLLLPAYLHILCNTLAGLHYAHELVDYDGTQLEIVHRDVSPHNVFVTYDGHVKVVDFGIARAADTEDPTTPGVFKGKFAYAAPEQLLGLPIDRRADVFSAGVMLWEGVVGRRFSTGKLSREAIEARTAGDYPRLADAAPQADPPLIEICDRAIALDPEHRFASAEEFRGALQGYLFERQHNVGAAELGALVRAKFVEERTRTHGLIGDHIRAQNLTESMVRSLREFSGDVQGSGGRDVTSSGTDVTPVLRGLRQEPSPPPQIDDDDELANFGKLARPQHGTKRMALAGTLVGLSLLLVWWNADSEQPSVVSLPPSPQAASSAAPPPREQALVETDVAAVQTPVPPSSPSSEEPPGHVSAPTPDRRDRRAARPGRPGPVGRGDGRVGARRAGPSARRHPPRRDATERRRRRAARRRLGREGPSRRVRRDATRRSHRASSSRGPSVGFEDLEQDSVASDFDELTDSDDASSVPSEEPERLDRVGGEDVATEEVNMGDDLRRMGERQKRELDLEDPF